MSDLHSDPAWRPRPNYRPRPIPPRRSGFGLLLISGLALLGVGTGYLFLTMRGNVTESGAIIPTIQADAAPIKERPENPGGIEVLHQDSTIYDAMGKGVQHADVEQLLPPSEKPDEKILAQAAPPVHKEEQLIPQIAQPIAAAAKPAEQDNKAEVNVVAEIANNKINKIKDVAVEVKAESEIRQVAAAVEKVVEKSAPLPEAKTVKAAVEPKPVPPIKEVAKPAVPQPFVNPEILKKQAVKRQPEVKEVKKAQEDTETLDIASILAKTEDVNLAKEEKMAALAKHGPVPAASMAKGMARLQLASSPNQEAAEKLRLEIAARHAALLRQAKLNLVRADLGSKGIYYRIQTQPMTAEEANQLCASLKAAKQGCMLMKGGN